MDNWFSASELADQGLTGWPQSKRNIQVKLNQIAQPKKRKRASRGGGYEYHISCLPKEIRGQLVNNTAKSLVQSSNTNIEQVQSPTPLTSIASLTGDQRATRDARATFVQQVNQLALHMGRSKAVDAVVLMVKEKSLPEGLENLLPIANARSGTKVTGSQKCQRLARRTLYSWVSTFEKEGVDALAPKNKEADWSLPDWVPFLMNLWADPRQPDLKSCIEDLEKTLPEDITCPSYHQANRFIKNKLNIVERNRGRMGPQELKSIKAFTRRDTSELWPGAIMSSDGHTFKAKVEHPFHGRPFKPEITMVIDVYTRYVTGFSLGLAENSMGVLEALSDSIVERHDGRKKALPAIWYTDNGKGFRANIFEDEHTGFYARWGITPKNSLPYNSQARGIIENPNKTILHKLAKTLPTYDGPALDKQAKRAIDRERAIKGRKGQRASFEVTWAEFYELVQEAIDQKNNSPHRGLPRVRDPETKKYRHLTPLEMWENWEAEGGKTTTISLEQAADLVRPVEKRKIIRGEVQLPWGKYFSFDLEPFHGEWASVSYDINNASQVWVRSIEDDRLLAVAKRDGNKKAYFDHDTLRTAVSKQEYVLEQRTKGRLKRVDEKREEILAEAEGPALEMEPIAPLALTSDQENQANEIIAEFTRIEPVQNAVTGRPNFMDDLEYVIWLHQNPQEVTEQDRGTVAKLVQSQTFAQLLKMEGIDPKPMMQTAA